MESLVRQIADIVHRANKEFYLEVKPNPDQLKNQDWAAYLSYLKYADKLIVFSNSIFIETDPIAVSLTVQNLESLGLGKMIYELGLWQDDTQSPPSNPVAMTAEAAQKLMLTATQAGVTAFWFTPSYLITPAHWKKRSVYPRIVNRTGKLPNPGF